MAQIHGESDLRALVLVGGKSLRMKTAKAQLCYGSKPQWQALDHLLSPLGFSVYFSVFDEQSLPLPKERLIVDLFRQPIGPLGGILSAFKESPSCAWLILACDMPCLDESAVRYLLKNRDPKKKATVFVKDQIEPLCAIYEPAIFLDLARAWAQGVYCPKAILSGLELNKLRPLDEAWLTNINHAHEYEAFKQRSAQDLKTIKVFYYASLREAAGRSEELVSTKASSIIDLYRELKERYGFFLDDSVLRFALKDRLVDKNTGLCHEDEVVFIPPVAGG